MKATGKVVALFVVAGLGLSCAQSPEWYRKSAIAPNARVEILWRATSHPVVEIRNSGNVDVVIRIDYSVHSPRLPVVLSEGERWRAVLPRKMGSDSRRVEVRYRGGKRIWAGVMPDDGVLMVDGAQ